MDFLNHREGVMVFYQVFIFSLVQCPVTLCKRLREFEEMSKRLREFEEIKISVQSCRGDCE
jgi:hypothetical protein